MLRIGDRVRIVAQAMYCGDSIWEYDTDYRGLWTDPDVHGTIVAPAKMPHMGWTVEFDKPIGRYIESTGRKPDQPYMYTDWVMYEGELQKITTD